MPYLYRSRLHCLLVPDSCIRESQLADCLCELLQIEKEFPQILPIHDSLRKYVFEPNAKNQTQVLAAVKEMRGR